MPLSQNIYELDNLSAELLYRLEQNDLKGAREVGKELHSSLESDLLWRTLVFAWLLSEADRHTTPSRWHFFRSRHYDEFIEIFRTAPFRPVQFPDPVTTTKPLIPEIDVTVPINWVYPPMDWSERLCNSLCYYVAEALQKGECWRAYLLARPLLNYPSSLASFLTAFGINHSILSFAGTHALNERILEHSMYIIAYNVNPIAVEPDRKYYSERCFSITPQALNRWNVPSKPFDKLIGFPQFIFEDQPYWKRITDEYCINPDPKYNYTGESEILVQDFFSVAFPNDIPDEWSIEERQKSHGLPYQPEVNPWAESFHKAVCFPFI